MRATIDGMIYDTEEAEAVLSGDSGRLCRTTHGDFFLIEFRDTLAGREGCPHERTDPQAAMRRLGQQLEDYWMIEEADSRPDDYWERCKRWEIVVPFTPKQAMEWAIKEAMPDCFKGYLPDCL